MAKRTDRIPPTPPRLPIKREPTHPGVLMREILEEHLKLPIAEAAKRMDVSRQTLHDTLRGRFKVTPDVALRFARLAGGGPELFLHMQTELDLWHARRRLEKRLGEIEPARAK